MSNKRLLVFQALTPEGVLIQLDSLNAVNVPLADGAPIGIHPGHAPLIAETTLGTVTCRSQTDEHKIELFPGILSIRDNIVTILTAGRADEESKDKIVPEAAEYERLMQTLVNKMTSPKESESDANVSQF